MSEKPRAQKRSRYFTKPLPVAELVAYRSMLLTPHKRLEDGLHRERSMRSSVISQVDARIDLAAHGVCYSTATVPRTPATR